MDKAEQKWLSVGICPKCGIDLRTHRDINGDIDQAICINNNCNFKYPEATNDSKPVDKLIEKYEKYSKQDRHFNIYHLIDEITNDLKGLCDL